MNVFNVSEYDYCKHQTKEESITFKYFKENRHVVKPLVVSVTAAVLSSFISVTNVVIFWAILRRPSLRTPANFLICWLSSVDALVGLLYLPTLAAFLIEHDENNSCILIMVNTFTGWFFLSTSSLTIVAVSCERYIALFYPLRYPSIITIKKLAIVVTLIGITSLLLSSFVFMGSTAKVLRYSIGSILLTLGLLVIFGTYTRIFKLVRRHHHQINAQQIGDTNNARQRKLAVTMAYVIGVSLVCYLQLGIVLVDIVIRGLDVKNTGYRMLSYLLFSTSSLWNPFIYCFKSEEIRGAVVQLLRDVKNKCSCSQ